MPVNKIKHKRVAPPDAVIGNYNPPSKIEWKSDDTVVELVRICPPSTHRKETVYEYRHIAPKTDKLGRPSTKFGKILTMRKEDIDKLKKQFYTHLYYDPSTAK